MKQLRNREIARRVTPQPYYPQSPILRGIVPNRKWNLTLLYASCAGKKKSLEIFLAIFTREKHEELIKQIKKICHLHFKVKLLLVNIIWSI